MANLIDFLGRLLISALFLISAYNKIFSIDGTMSWMEGFGIPGFLLYPTIALEIILPLFIIIGYQARLSAGLLAIFCIATAFLFHYDFVVFRYDCAMLRYDFAIFHYVSAEENIHYMWDKLGRSELIGMDVIYAPRTSKKQQNKPNFFSQKRNSAFIYAKKIKIIQILNYFFSEDQI